jgi:hypothetical protein
MSEESTKKSGSEQKPKKKLRSKKLFVIIERNNLDRSVRIALMKYATDKRLISSELSDIIEESEGKDLSFLLLEGDEVWHSTQKKGGSDGL